MSNDSESLESVLEISSELADRLRKEFGSLAMLAMSSPTEVAERGGLGTRTAQQIVLKARQAMDFAPITASELLEDSADQPRISTGSQALDEIMELQ